jgi:hypothetical protein
MRMVRLSAVLVCLGFACTMCAVRTRADVLHQTTMLTFTAPVEVPGVVLAPGTYEFRIFATNSDLNHVEILSGDGMHLITSVMTIPVTRSETSGKTEVRFEKRAPGAPEAIKDWFYAGDTDGHEFLYPSPVTSGHQPTGSASGK